jgi:hypothetical protein
MTDVAHTHHLLKRGNRWYFRRRVPTHLLQKAGTPVVQYSLDTADKAEAQRRARIEDVKTDKWFAALEAGTAIASDRSNLTAPRQVTLDELVEHARTFVETEDQKRAARLLADPPDSEDQRLDMLEDAGAGRMIAQTPAHPDRRRLVENIAAKIADRAGIDAAEPPASLLAVAARILTELARRQEARLEGDHSAVAFDAMFTPSAAGTVPKTTVQALADQYLAALRVEHKLNGIAGKTTEKHATVLEYVVEALGPKTVVATIDYDKVQEVRSIIARTPANRNKVYPGVSLAKAIERGGKDGKPTLMHLTQRTYCEAVRNLLKFATHKKLLPSNPAEDLKPLLKETVPLDQKRLPFSADQLAAFFTGTFYRSCVPGAAKPYHKPDRAWRFWLPPLSLFSGARPNEVCQLFVEDIKQTKTGTWYFDFVNEDEDQSRKNEASKRCVPIHSEIVRLGFLDFVAARRQTMAKHGPRLFHEIPPKKGEPANLAFYPCKRFNEAFLSAEITVEARQSFYSLRHTVRDALRRAKVGEEALFAIGGWTPTGGRAVSSHYGDIRNPDLWVEDVEKIAYPGLDLSFLYPGEAQK